MVKNKLEKWKTKVLTLAGRVTLSNCKLLVSYIMFINQVKFYLQNVECTSYMHQLHFQNCMVASSSKIWIMWNHKIQTAVEIDHAQLLSICMHSTVLSKSICATFIYARHTF